MAFQATFTVRNPRIIEFLIQNGIYDDDSFAAYFTRLAAGPTADLEAFLADYFEETTDYDNDIVDMATIKTFFNQERDSREGTKPLLIKEAIRRAFPKVKYNKTLAWQFADETEWTRMVGNGERMEDHRNDKGQVSVTLNHVFNGLRFKVRRPCIHVSPVTKSPPKKRKRTTDNTVASSLPVDSASSSTSRPTVSGKAPSRAPMSLTSRLGLPDDEEDDGATTDQSS